MAFLTYTLAIDPGKSTGVVLGHYSHRGPWVRHFAWQIEGGLDGFLDWIRPHLPSEGEYDDYPYNWHFHETGYIDELTVISEKFILRGNDFVADTEPLRIEGAIIALGMQPVWQPRTDKALVPDSVLRENGLWLTGKDVGCKDARDADDAQIHSLVYMKRIQHLPTLRQYWPETKKD